MIIYCLVLLPLIAGLIAMFIRARQLRRLLLIGTATIQVLITIAVWVRLPAPVLGGWLAIDALGLVFLTITSVLFLASSIYAVGYLRNEESKSDIDFEEGFLFTNEPEAAFIGCLLMFLAAMTFVTLCQHLGLLWIGIEATTLASAPLIYFHRHHRSLEATWKYILICSVGIALALLGNFILAVAASNPNGEPIPLVLNDLLNNAGAMNIQWLHAAFLFFLVGYGTKMGLAPLHTWLPDAHSESPSLVSALLSGSVLNCAFLGILRAHQICVAAGEAQFSQNLLVIFGLLSMGIAAAFVIRQTDFKRMLAYSSVEHVGILALGVGLGGAGAFGSMLHAVNHSFTKAALFLLAGNILAVYKTKSIGRVSGVLQVLPITAGLWIAGFLSITGSPPFGTFFSEFTILKAALDGKQYTIGVLYLLFLSLIFIGMANVFLRMAQGTPDLEPDSSFLHKEPLWKIGPPAVLIAIVVVLGSYLPRQLNDVLENAANQVCPPTVVVEMAEQETTPSRMGVFEITSNESVKPSISEKKFPTSIALNNTGQ